MASKSAIVAGRGEVVLGIDDSPLRAGLNAASAHVRSWGGNIARIGASMAAAGASIVTPLLGAVHLFTQTGDDMIKMSQRVGMTVEALSELRHAAGQSAVSAEALETSMKELSKLFDGASTASAEATEQLSVLGLTVADLQPLTQDMRFELLADRISQIGDPARRAAAAMGVFGRSGASLLPMLADGAAGIQALREEARRLGLTMSTEDASAAAALGDQFANISNQAKMVVFHLGAALAPTLKLIADQIVEVMSRVTAWIRENSQLVTAVFAAGVAIVGVGAAIMTLGGVIYGVGVGFSVLAGTVSLIGSLLAGLWSATMFAASGFGILKVASFLWSAASVTASAIASAGVWAYNVVIGIAHALTYGLKVALVALGVTAAAVFGGLYIAAAYFGIRWLITSGIIESTIARLRTLVAEITAQIRTRWAAAIEGLGVAWSNMAAAAGRAFDFVAGVVSRVGSIIGTAASETAASFQRAFGEIVASGTQAWGALSAAFNSGNWSLVWETVRVVAQLAWAHVSGFVQETFIVWRHAALESINVISDAIEDGVGGAWNEVKLVAADVLDWINAATLDDMTSLTRTIFSTWKDMWWNIAATAIEAWGSVSRLIGESVMQLASTIGARLGRRVSNLLGIGTSTTVFTDTSATAADSARARAGDISSGPTGGRRAALESRIAFDEMVSADQRRQRDEEMARTREELLAATRAGSAAEIARLRGELARLEAIPAIASQILGINHLLLGGGVPTDGMRPPVIPGEITKTTLNSLGAGFGALASLAINGRFGRTTPEERAVAQRESQIKLLTEAVRELHEIVKVVVLRVS